MTLRSEKEKNICQIEILHILVLNNRRDENNLLPYESLISYRVCFYKRPSKVTNEKRDGQLFAMWQIWPTAWQLFARLENWWRSSGYATDWVQVRPVAESCHCHSGWPRRHRRYKEHRKKLHQVKTLTSSSGPTLGFIWATRHGNLKPFPEFRILFQLSLIEHDGYPLEDRNNWPYFNFTTDFHHFPTWSCTLQTILVRGLLN